MLLELLDSIKNQVPDSIPIVAGMITSSRPEIMPASICSRVIPAPAGSRERRSREPHCMS